MITRKKGNAPGNYELVGPPHVLLCIINFNTCRWWASLLSGFTKTKAVVVVPHSSCPLPSKSKLLSYQNKRFFEYLDSGEHPRATVCVWKKGKCFLLSFGECAWSHFRTFFVIMFMPTVSALQKVLCFL